MDSHKLNIAVIGSKGCGKTKFISCLDGFGTVFSFLELSLLDPIPDSAVGVVVLFDLCSFESYAECEAILNGLNGKTFPVLLAGNKTDLPRSRVISARTSHRTARRYEEDTSSSLTRVCALEVCAKNGFHTPKVIEFFVSEIVSQKRYPDGVLVSLEHSP